MNNPDEYAEFATALLTHLRSTYGLTADYWVVYNEPSGHFPLDPDIPPRMLANIIKRLGPRLRTEGFPTKIQFPEAINIRSALSYLDALTGDIAVWEYVGLFSYHLYGGGSRDRLREWNQVMHMPTAQTEKIGAGLDQLCWDLTQANVSSWEKYVLHKSEGYPKNHYYNIPFDYSCFCMTGSGYRYSHGYWELRQVFHYVRPGDIRIEISSSDSTVRPLAFVNQAGKYIVIVINSDGFAQDIAISNMPGGSYNVILTASKDFGKELPPHHLADGQSLTFRIPPNGVVTFQQVERGAISGGKNKIL